MGFSSPSSLQGLIHQQLTRLILQNGVPPGAERAAEVSNGLPSTGEKTLPAQAQGGDLFQTGSQNAAGSLDETFTSLVYHSQVEKIALEAKYLGAQATTADGQEGTTEAELGFEQLAFSFFSETRTEELVLFQERTAAVTEGQTESTRTQYASLTQEVAVRFEMSATFSGAALDGFAGASETLGDNLEDLFGEFLGFVSDLLGEEDSIVQEMLEMFGGLFSGADGADGIGDSFNALLEQAYGVLGAPANSGTAIQSGGAFQVQLEFEFSFSASIQVTQAEVQQSDPIVLDLDGDGIELTHYSQGASFDIEGVGRQVSTAFVTGGDGFLALDRNGNGSIDSGRELFGDQYGAANGFEELRKLDANGDGVIDAHDPAFDQLVLFVDNGNGRTDDGELVSLAEAGISEIDLNYRNVAQRAAGANHIGQTAFFRRDDGSRGAAADAILNFTV